jgi:hypothetical protein
LRHKTRVYMRLNAFFHSVQLHVKKAQLTLSVLACKEGPRINATLDSDFMKTYVQKGGREKTNSLRD